MEECKGNLSKLNWILKTIKRPTGALGREEYSHCNSEEHEQSRYSREGLGGAVAKECCNFNGEHRACQ